MQVVEVRPGDLKPATYNPRRMTEGEAEGLRESIRRFGLVDPLVVNRHKGRENVMVGGHQRLRVSQEPEFAAKFKTVPVVYVDLDETRERELNLRLNKNLGSWDWDALANLDVDELLDVGFTKEELATRFDLAEGPEEFTESGEAIRTDHECPKCHYKWSGRQQ
jgi:ParB-like chromosome segregation protein Spo0J